MDADTEPTELSKSVVHKAVNRTFRGGRNKKRPPFREIQLSFENTEDEDWFRNANFQGWSDYLKVAPGRKDGLVISIAGRIFFVSLVNETANVKRIFSNNDPKLLQAWFCQAEDWIYIQDGKDPAIFWDGLSAAKQSGGTENRQMPVGTVMAYTHGRMFVGNAYNQIWASDVMFGNGFTNTSNVQNGLEGIYAAKGGSFVFPNSLGKITAMTGFATMGQNNRGEGPLMVFGTNGAMSMPVGVDRLLWSTQNMQTIEIKGRGCFASESLVDVNGDLWFRSNDGLGTLVHFISEQAQHITFKKVSKPVNYWLNKDTKWLTQYASAIYFNNRFFLTTQPEISLTRDDRWGSHRYFRGMVVADLDTLGGDGVNGINWEGLWTGVRPCGLVKANINDTERAFVFSHDRDGKNRIYEITTNDHGFDNNKVPVKSFYITKNFVFRETGAGDFDIKRIIGGDGFVSDVVGEASIGLSFRQNYDKGFVPIQTEELGCQDYQDGIPLSFPKSYPFKIKSVEEGCSESGDVIGTGYSFQLKVDLVGDIQVNRLRLKCEVKTQETREDCQYKLEQVCQPSVGQIEDDFEYYIV
jgi:hypothetical protein